ncbi:hypothetical protein EDB89DRAFT_2063953 [Lactarius sanguifluus]|nr:hypothetical protein EDB89DRAFT_2063953 [Lactarius sanguifluus]
MAENATLIVPLSGGYRSKKEVAYTLVPAIGRRVIDLSGSVEESLLCSFSHVDNGAQHEPSNPLSGVIKGNKAPKPSSPDVCTPTELFPAPLWLAYGDKILHNKFDDSIDFSIDGCVKDTTGTHIRRLSTEHNSPMSHRQCATPSAHRSSPA